MIFQPEPHKVPVDELVLWEENPRNSSVELIGTSMERFGMNSTPAYRNEETNGEVFKIVYGGNHRVKAARAADLEYLWMTNLDHLTREEAQQFAMADNRVTDLASYDSEKHAELIASVSQQDDQILRDFKYGDDERDQIISGMPYETDLGMPAPGDAPSDLSERRFGVIVQVEDYSQQEELMSLMLNKGFDNIRPLQ